MVVNVSDVVGVFCVEDQVIVGVEQRRRELLCEARPYLHRVRRQGELRGRRGVCSGSGDPEVEIRLRRTIGRMYGVLAKHGEARAQLQLALQKQLPLARPDDPSLGMLYVDLAGVEYRNQQATEAERDAQSAASILEKARGRENRIALMFAYNYLGVARTQNGKTFAEQEEPMLGRW